MAFLVALGIVKAHKDDNEGRKSEEEKQQEQFAQQAAILLEPKLRDKRPLVNHLAALVLTLNRPNRRLLLEAMGYSNDKAFSPIMGYLTDHCLVGSVREVDPRPAYYYAPLPALEWAAGKPDDYPELAQSLTILRAEMPDPSGNS